MEVKINYTELQDYILSKFGKKVGFSYANFSTITVSTKVSVLGFSKTVGIDLAFEKIEDTVLYVSYGGKFGIELLVSPAIYVCRLLMMWKCRRKYSVWFLVMFLRCVLGHRTTVSLQPSTFLSRSIICVVRLDKGGDWTLVVR